MTREEASFYLANMDRKYMEEGMSEALDMAIKALEQEQSSDAISRQAVFEQIAEWIISGEYGFTNATDYLSKKIKALPSVTPQQRTGRWIVTDDDLVYCSECEDSYYPRPIDASWYYCPHCGAKMEVEE